MRVRTIQIKNFKRFTDITIDEIGQDVRLVLLVGPNGCGKSSVLEALYHWYKVRCGKGYENDDAYFRKNAENAFRYDESVIVAHDIPEVSRGSMYIRTAYRHEPDFNASVITKQANPAEETRFHRLIDGDATVSANYMRMIYETMAGLYQEANDGLTVAALRESIIGPIRTSLKNVFGDLALSGIGDPMSGGSFYFSKGQIKNYHYKNLSGGEKAGFDLLLDLHVKKASFDNALYLMDEIETHLHTKVQGALLQEILRIIPDNSQLWLTTHSLGVIREAQRQSIAAPGTVAIIDFEGIDPDVEQIIRPSSVNRVSWDRMMSIALGDLSQQIITRRLIVCEGSSVGTRRKDFDAEIYSRILGSHDPEISFISGGNSEQIQALGVSMAEIMSTLTKASVVRALCDRDEKSDEEVERLERGNTIVLGERNIETYLFADDVIEALLVKEGKTHLLADALQIKADAIADSVARGNTNDNLKRAAGKLVVDLKRLLQLNRSGNNTDAFMRDTMAHLIVPGMRTYDQLKAAISDRVP